MCIVYKAQTPGISSATHFVWWSYPYINNVSESADLAPGSVVAGTIAAGGVLPGNTNTGVIALDNGSLEIPNAAGTMPAGWDYNNSGALVYSTSSGMDGQAKVTLGGSVTTHRFQGPMIQWAWDREPGISLDFFYTLSTLTGTAVTFGMAQYDKNKAFLADKPATNPGGGGFVWVTTPTTEIRGVFDTTALNSSTVYVAPYVQVVVSSGTGTLAVDSFRIDEAGGTIYPLTVQGSSNSGLPLGAIAFSGDVTLTPLSGNSAVLNGPAKLGSTGSTPILKVLSATAALNFPSTLSRVSADLTITLTGAALGDCVWLGVPNGSVTADAVFSAWVSAADTVKVRFYNGNAGAQDPASGTFRVSVVQF
jgi:hypothetical protein